MYSGTLNAANNRADWMFLVELLDADTNDVVDLSNSIITVALRPYSHNTPTLVGTNLDGHLTVEAPSVFRVHFTRAEMTQFPAGEIDVGITLLYSDGNTYPLFHGQVPVVDGVVPA